MTLLTSSLFFANVVVVLTCLVGIVVGALLGPLKDDATRLAPDLMKSFQKAVNGVVDVLEKLLSSAKGNAQECETGFLDANIAEIRSEMSNFQSSSAFQSATDAIDTQSSGEEVPITDDQGSMVTPVKEPNEATEDQTDSEHSPEQAPPEQALPEQANGTSESIGEKKTMSAASDDKSKITMVMLDSSVALQLQSAVSRRSKYGNAIHPVEFRKFTVIKVGKITNDSVRIRFSIPENRKLDIPVGRHVVVQATINGQVVRRPYTPVTRVDFPGCFDLVVKGYEFGKMSSYLQKLSAMDEVEIRGPIGNFNYRMNTYRHVCFIAGGTGLTPCLQTITSVLEMPEYQQDNCFFTLLYQSRSEGDILLLHELRSLHQKYNKRLTIAFFVSSPSHSTWGSRIGQVRGCVNEEYLKKMQGMTPQPDIYCVAGPSGFNTRVENTLKDIDSSKAVFVF